MSKSKHTLNRTSNIVNHTLFAFAFLLLGSITNAQNTTISYNSTAHPDGAFTVCGTAETNSLKISNGNSATMTNTLVTLHFPPGGSYVAGTITGATESNISNLNAPVFSVPDIPASNNATITYQAMFGCAVIAYQSGGGLTYETADFSYKLNGVSKTQTGVAPPSTYNTIAAALSIISFNPTSYTGNVGSSFTQTATIRNGGLGCTTTAFVKLGGNGSYTFSSPSVGTISNDTLFLSTGDMPGGDSKWCNTEDVTVSYTVTINNCSNLNRSTFAGWGCGGSSCQQSTAVSSNVIIGNSVPNLTATVVNPNYNYCFRGDVVKQTFRIINTGTGPATNIKLSVRNVYPGSFSGVNYFDTTVTWQVRDKQNNPIGVVSGFVTAGATIILNSTCTNVTRYTTVTGNLNPSLTLLANDTFYVDVYSMAQNLSCNLSTCRDAMGSFAIQTQLDYKNQCGSGAYQEAYKAQISRAITEYVNNVNIPTDVSGGQPFNIEIDWKSFTNMQNPDGSGTTYFALPLTGTDVTPTVSSISFASLTLPVYVANDTMFIGPIPQNISRGGNHMTIPMQASCGTGGLKTLNTFILTKYSSCSPVTKFGCRTSTITIHCPTPCPKGGATPINFSLNRINYGQVDNNNDGKPDVSGNLDMNKINTHHSVNGDTLQGVWNIKINPNNDSADANFGQTFQYTYLDFNVGAAYGSPGSLTPIPNADVTIYPAGGGAPINCTVSPTITGNKAHYDFNTCHTPWANGDSMVVKARYIVNSYNSSKYGRNVTSGYDMFISQNEVYSTYAPQTTPTTAPIANTTYTCDHFNDYNEISRIWLSPYMPAGQSIVGCNNSLQAYMRYYTRNQEGGLIFPYEYRNFFIPDTMVVWIPPGFVYRPNTATLTGTNISTTISITNANVYQVADTLYFINLKNNFTTNGGVVVPGDETSNYLLTFSVNPTCASAGGSYSGGTNTSGLGNGLNTPATDYHLYNAEPVSPLGYTQTNPTYIYNAPQPYVAGGGTVVTNDGLATWTIQLQNLSNNTPASNSYFYISPAGAFTNIVVKEGTTTLTPDANGFYLLGSLAASANRNFTVTANLGKCSIDSMRLNFGSDCSGIPTTFVAQSCTQYASLKASGFPPALDVTFDKLASGTVDLCAPFEVEAVINSTLVGNLASETYKVILPAKMSYVNNSTQVLYPVGGSYAASAYNPTIGAAITGDTLTFAVNSLTGNTGLTGVGDLVHNQVKIKIQLQTACGYVSGQSIKATVNAVSPCGDPVPTIVKTSSAVSLTGAAATTQYSIKVNAPNSFSTCGAAQTVTVTVTNTGTASPPANDSMSINLSNGLSLVSGSVTGIHNGPSPAAPVVVNGTTLRWQIPNTVAPGDSMKFTMQLAANSAGCGFNTMDLYATQSIVLMCNSLNCTTPVITGQLISDTITTICCVDMQVHKTVNPSTVAAGGTVVYTVAAYNAGPGTATNVVVNDVLPAGVTYVSNTRTHGTWSAPDWTIPTMAAGQRDTIRFTVIADNSTTSAITVGNTAYIKSIDNTTPEINRTNDTSSVNLTINANCTGVGAGSDQTVCGGNNVTLTGAPTTGAWTALGTNPIGATLGSTTSGVASASFVNSANGNYDFIFTDGVCKDTMRVVVRAATISTTNLSICANQLPYTWNGLTFNAAGTQTAHLTNAAGCDSAATLNLTVNAMPNAGSNQTVTCYITSTATMNATGTGTWSAAVGNPGTATIATPSSPTTSISNFSAAGTYSFIWTNAAGCGSSVTIIVGSTCCRAGSVAPLVKP